MVHHLCIVSTGIVEVIVATRNFGFWKLGRFSGWPRHRENREFGSYFFQTGKTQGILL